MRYIDLSKIRIKVKKIKWIDVKKKHLEDLIFTESKSGEEYISWDDIKEKHLKKIEGLSAKDRKEYITNNPDWNILQKIMIEEYGLNCWYSEAPVGNGIFEIDHFRPKNRARQSEEKKSDIYKKDGYWWLAYELDNFRLSGAMSNKRRRDKLRENSEVEGKGDIFPLDLENGKIAKDKCSTFCENPLLLDPMIPSDIGLLTFDEGGSIQPNPLIQNDFDRKRAEISIKLLHLDSDQLEIPRQQVWTVCSEAIESAYLYFTESDSDKEKKLAMTNCAKILFDRTNPKSAFSSTAKVCINTYRKQKGYCDIIEILGL